MEHSLQRPLSPGLRLLFVVSALGTLATSVGGIFAPKLIADLSGLPGVDIPVYQQAGALTFGQCVAAFLSVRASRWDEVRIPAAASFAFGLLTSIGGLYYYVLLQGAVGPYLLVGVPLAVLFTLAFGYYLWTYRQRVGR